MRIQQIELTKLKKIFICILSVLIVSVSLLTVTQAYSYNAYAEIYYTTCSGHQNGIHYTFNKGTVAAKECQAKCNSDGDPTLTRKPTVYLELRRRTLIGGIGYKSFGEKTLGTVKEGQGWTSLKNTSWTVDEKNSTYYLITYMTSSEVQKYFKCTLSQ